MKRVKPLTPETFLKLKCAVASRDLALNNIIMKPAFLRAEWRKLAIANYCVDSRLLLPFLPHKTELDLWNDKCYVSLVGFRFINTRLKGISIPFHRHFEEVNLRFYVRYKDTSGWKRGVTFIKEIVPKRALSVIANTIYKEKYITCRMKHAWEIDENFVSISYQWRHDGAWNTFALTAKNSPSPIEPNSEEEFITEHYWGYTQFKKGLASEYGVEHPRWETYPIVTNSIDVDFGKVYGQQFAFLNNQKADSIMLAEGSEIVVRSMTLIK